MNDIDANGWWKFPVQSPTEMGSPQWKEMMKSVCKPCWELKYCPYGPLVELFPLPSPSRKEMEKHNEMLKMKLKKGLHKDNPELRKKVEDSVDQFVPENYPEEADSEEGGCLEFGHYCPVFFVGEGFTETKEVRRISRHIPRPTIIRVVKRDSSTCQVCGKNLMDREIEVDHIIPFSKGGPSSESNLRVICSLCNQQKKASLDKGFLHETE
jgi:hypothetical protein